MPQSSLLICWFVISGIQGQLCVHFQSLLRGCVSVPCTSKPLSGNKMKVWFLLIESLLCVGKETLQWSCAETLHQDCSFQNPQFWFFGVIEKDQNRRSHNSTPVTDSLIVWAVYHMTLTSLNHMTLTSHNKMADCFKCPAGAGYV